MSELDHIKSKLRLLAEERQDRDRAKKAAETAEAKYRATEAEVIELIEDSGLKGALKFDFGGDLGTIQFTKGTTVYGRVVDKEAAIRSFEERGVGEQMTGVKFEARRLNELAREIVESGEEPPDGFDFHEKKYVSISFKGTS